MRPTPDLPATNDCHVASAVSPIGLTTPMPVTTILASVTSCSLPACRRCLLYPIGPRFNDRRAMLGAYAAPDGPPLRLYQGGMGEETSYKLQAVPIGGKEGQKRLALSIKRHAQ